MNQSAKEWFMINANNFTLEMPSPSITFGDNEPRKKEAKTLAEKRSLKKSLKNCKKKKIILHQIYKIFA